MSLSMETFCRSIPKVELHAHLSGSVSMSSLLAFSSASKVTRSELEKSKESLSLRSVFQSYFPLIHSLITTHDRVYNLTRQVMEEFRRDNVVYLELRTTPKTLEGDVDHEKYVRTVCNAIEDHNHLSIGPLVRLLLSIDRSKHGVKEAEAIVKLANELRLEDPTCPIVGIDVSGDPHVGSLVDLESVLRMSREDFHLPLSIHMGETMDGIEEASFVINHIHPDRIAHGLTLSPRQGGPDDLWQMLKMNKQCFEVCISSNLASKSITDIMESHVVDLEREGMMYALCTDDKGVFGTHLSTEYLMAANCLKWTTSEVFERALRAVDHAFCSHEEKQRIKMFFHDYAKQHMVCP